MFNSELTHDFIAERLYVWCEIFDGLKGIDFDEDIDDWLCEDVGDRGAADMFNGNSIVSKYSVEDGFLLAKESLPLRVMRGDECVHGWIESRVGRVTEDWALLRLAPLYGMCHTRFQSRH